MAAITPNGAVIPTAVLFNDVSEIVDEQSIKAHANECTYLTIIWTDPVRIKGDWRKEDVGCFERFWRWILSIFCCAESVEMKCARLSRDILGDAITLQRAQTYGVRDDQICDASNTLFTPEEIEQNINAYRNKTQQELEQMIQTSMNQSNPPPANQ